MKRDAALLEHMLAMVRRIEEHTKCGKDAFLASDLHQDAVLRNLHTLTETTQRLSPTLKARHPEIEWAKLAAFRNVVVHDYLGIDLELVWAVVENDVPRLKASLVTISTRLAQPGARG